MTFTPTDPTKAEVRVTGTAPNQSLDFYIPRGAKGEPGGFNTGTDLVLTDLNTVLAPGLYRQSNGANAQTTLNYPIVYAAGSLEVISSNGTADLMQRYTPMAGAATGSGRAMYIRRYFAGVWGAWYVYTSTRVDQTAGRAIYQWDDVNGREQLIFGDTGLRDVYLDQTWLDALYAVGSVDKNAGNVVRVRRTNSIVTIHWALDKAASGTVSAPAAFPLGFRPVGPLQSIGSNSGMALVRCYHGGGTAGMSYNSTVAVPASSITLAYSTADPWPTTLPGTAIGSIPNV